MIPSHLKGELMDWMKGDEMPVGIKSSEIRHALVLQITIGWKQFWTGKMGSPWVHIQQNYVEAKGKGMLGLGGHLRW